jgi:hypothetical protein
MSSKVIEKPCELCEEMVNAKEVPDLKCGCFICPQCYCKLKSEKIHRCIWCNEKLQRNIKYR